MPTPDKLEALRREYHILNRQPITLFYRNGAAQTFEEYAARRLAAMELFYLPTVEGEPCR